MTAFDTDILSELLEGTPAYVLRANAIAIADQFIPVVVATEILRGRLNAIRQAEAGKGKLSLERAYSLFELSLEGIESYQMLAYSADADSLYKKWKSNIRIGSQDLRIAAICVAHGAKLVTRNARDFALVPGLDLEIWN